MNTLSGLPLTTIATLAFSLLAGLLAAYGLELQSGRHPPLRWWAARVLLVPFLAIGSMAIQATLRLPLSTMAFIAALLSLGGHDGVRLIERQWRDQLLTRMRAHRSK